ncbi:conserved Plasmodium protein, unknown function [Plasmodium knowlesi strain H]|uniref:Uncharacterized protein n=3 Tax=Plasmodium knowlesi TaxID=5850 RepID=A0A5K1VCF1_PLAKH|nr:conserved protein, unknown function [Plasmodium knowlesi strain H]OTN64024.1 Uncharacterized protein PKNOH_S140238700 [Plasmodium knowlesi]CAA9990809.1 conserved protein, unknown function [Plasmodium knowlesi strain H]SBO21027.1 conserved Plasmodium protein, unknown function [Plasmodium knowlesi strain H]SBO21519.1 conserved Plasmodium protein, unknown function [Plasmodium knowlesi strain H]VVS80283.1 conserved protein, unknown function [Plasmodium knowlesi strain H]|eukprot:XP_002262097.1 hypothetical protein, conserved in Plasmodium species [Plasmodium knowlesi strain H]
MEREGAQREEARHRGEKPKQIEHLGDYPYGLHSEEDSDPKDFRQISWIYKDIDNMLKEVNEKCSNLNERGASGVGMKLEALPGESYNWVKLSSQVNSSGSAKLSNSKSSKHVTSSYSSGGTVSQNSSYTSDEMDNLSLSDELSVEEDSMGEDGNGSSSVVTLSGDGNGSSSVVTLSEDGIEKSDRTTPNSSNSPDSSNDEGANRKSGTEGISSSTREEDNHPNVYYNCITIFSLNSYLYNDMYRYNPHLYGIYETCRNNEKRCKKIGLLCSQYDLIFLRSVFGKYQKNLYDVLKYTHSVLLDNVPSSYTILNEILYTLQNYVNGNGGLFICWRKKVFHLSYYDYMFLSSDILFKRKVIKIVKLIFKGKYSLYILHCEFDLYSVQNKLSNLDDLVVLMKKTLWKIYLFQIFYINRKLFKKREGSAHNMEKLSTHEYVDKMEAIAKMSKAEKELHTKDEVVGSFSNLPDDEKGDSTHTHNGNTSNMLKEDQTDKSITTMTFRNSSMLVIGSFNIDVNEDRTLYDKLVNLNGQGKMKDLFFHKNINYKLQKTYDIVDRKNTLVSGLNYSFGLTDNIFLVESFFINSKDITELAYLFSPSDVISEKMSKLNKSLSRYNLEGFSQLINKNGVFIKFQDLFNYGVDILTQKKGNEFSDHWALSARIHLKNPTKSVNLHIEKQLRNFLINVDKYFVLGKRSYHELCAVVTSAFSGKQDPSRGGKGAEDKFKKKNHKEEAQMDKYNYTQRCIISSANINCIHKVEKRLYNTLSRCFESD